MIYTDKEKSEFGRRYSELVREIWEMGCAGSLETLERKLINNGVIRRLRGQLPIPGGEHKNILGLVDLFQYAIKNNLHDINVAMKEYEGKNGGVMPRHHLYNVWYALTFCRDKPNSFAVNAWKEAENQLKEAHGKDLEEFDISSLKQPLSFLRQLLQIPL